MEKPFSGNGNSGQRTRDTLLSIYLRGARAARIYDGADEGHKASLARQILKKYGMGA